MALMVKVNDKEYPVPPMTLGQLRRGLLEKLKESDKLAETSWLETAMMRGEIVANIIAEKYGLDPNDVFDSLDLHNFNPIWLEFMGLSGFKPGEVKAAETQTGT